MHLPTCVLFITLCCSYTWGKQDLYELLGVQRDATTKQIRKAFKLLAVKLHPDKNQDDENADEKFTEIARAYEVLKDDDTRKQYDLYGDVGANINNKPEYHSYTYYRDQFGIYDDDPLIVTLTKADFELNIVDSSAAWFVNFYSPNCHHCHELAPTWRKLSREFDGIIHIAAVNCEDDWVLCRQQKIHSYPSLIYYAKELHHTYDGKHFEGSRNFDSLHDFVLLQITSRVEIITPEEWQHDGLRKKQWLLLLCPEENSVCLEEEAQIKIAATLEGLMPIGLIKDVSLCVDIFLGHKRIPIVFWKVDEEKRTDSISEAEVHPIEGSDVKEIVEKVLKLLPDPQVLNEEIFKDIRSRLTLGAIEPWLICFYLGKATELSLQLKRLPSFLPQMNIGLVHCGKDSALCGSLHVSHYPSWGILKSGGAFELHHGRDVIHEIVTFAKDSSKSTNLHALSPADFYSQVKDRTTWFIDWYAPWCPPCRKLMPEIRRASQHFAPENVKFGTIDCTLHSHLCSQEGVRSYPTTALYNGSNVHYFHGVPIEEKIVEFVQDMLNPSVLNLDKSNFIQLIKKPATELWMVEYFAPWCGPCQKLAPQWRALAKQVESLDFVKVAQVDCEENSNLCGQQNVRSYPTIRLYPLGSKGLNTVAVFHGNPNVMSMKQWLHGFLPSPVEILTAKEFKSEVLGQQNYLPWLIDFYAPWCGHCVNFEPDFITVAQKLEGHIRSGKLDCEAERQFCREIRITSYPTVILYLSPHEQHHIETQMPSDIIKLVKNLIAQRKFPRDEL